VSALISAAPAGQAGKVFDVANPELLGKIITRGPEVLEVRFDDGAEHNVPNIHLCPVGASVGDELDNPTHPDESPEIAAIRHGQEAWGGLRAGSTWSDWVAVGTAHVIGRTTAMRDGHINKPKGHSYNAAFSAWQKKFGFEGLDKGDRSRLFDVMDHLKEIDGWLQKLRESERLRLNHPSSVWRRWKAAMAAPKPDTEPKPSPMQKLRDSVVTLQEENDRMRREIERDGGDLWGPEDRPRDMARVIIDKLRKTKAEKVAREILKALRNTPEERAALEEQINAIRQRSVTEHISPAEWADVDRMRKRVKRLQEMGL
jgi:hypothetical protein